MFSRMLVAISEYLLIDSLTLWLLAAAIKILTGLLHCLHCSHRNSAITGVIWIQPAKSLSHPLEVELPIKKSPQYAINILGCSINIHHNNIYFLSRSLRKNATKKPPMVQKP